jgi:hypothetical protein
MAIQNLTVHLSPFTLNRSMAVENGLIIAFLVRFMV